MTSFDNGISFDSGTNNSPPTDISSIMASVDGILLHRDKSDINSPAHCVEFTELEEYLKAWYDGISPRYVDLVSDFAGQEFFVLDGEALLQYVFNDQMLDLAGSKGG